MKIILIRHFKVNYKWKLFYNSLGYEKACEGYDKAHVLNAGLSLKINYEIFASTMIRAIETIYGCFNKVAKIRLGYHGQGSMAIRY